MAGDIPERRGGGMETVRKERKGDGGGIEKGGEKMRGPAAVRW